MTELFSLTRGRQRRRVPPVCGPLAHRRRLGSQRRENRRRRSARESCGAGKPGGRAHRRARARSERLARPVPFPGHGSATILGRDPEGPGVSAPHGRREPCAGGPGRGLPRSGHEESAGVLPSVALTLPGSNVLPSELAPTTTAILVRTHVSYDGIPRTLTEGWYCRSPVVERHRDRVNGA